MIAMKKIIVIIAACYFVLAANAQLLGSVNFDPKNLSHLQDSTFLGNNLFVDAIRPAFFLSRQSFQLSDKKTGDRYGLNNNDEFGTEITLGVKVKGGYVLTDKAVRPWNYNAKFKTYKEGYDPVLYSSEYSEFGGSAKFDTLNIAQPNELLSESLYLISSDCLFNKGLTVDCTKGKKEGWVVWACVDKDDDLSKTANLRLTCYSMAVEASEGGSIDVETPDNQRILGGVYVSPVNADIGVLEFRLSGVMIEKDDKWSIHFPFIGKEKLLKPAQGEDKKATEVDKGKDSLTPIDDIYQPKSPKDKKSKKKSKKNK